MWMSFCLVFALQVVLAITPGAVILFSLGVPLLLSFVCSIPVSVILYCVSGVATAAFGFYGVTPLLVLVALLVLASVLVGLVVRRWRGTSQLTSSSTLFGARNVPVILLFLLCGLVAFTVLYLKNIDGPISYIQYNDNHSHLAWIANAAQSGNYSTLAVSFYSPDSSAAPFTQGTFYPFGFHLIAAMGMALSGVSSPIAENAAVTVFAAVCFPLGIGGMLIKAFEGKKSVVLFGVIAMMASVAFPLRMLAIHGPFPNIAGFSCVPAALLLFILMVEARDDEEIVFNWEYVAPFLLVMGGTAVAHPNAFIFACIYMASYWIARIVFILGYRHPLRHGLTRLSQVIYLCASLSVMALVWIYIHNTSFMHSTVSFIWIWSKSFDNIVGNILNGGLVLGIPQAMWGAVVFLGFCFALTSRKTSWMSLAFVVVCVQLVLTGTGDDAQKSMVSGFWYTDPERLAAMVAITAIPLFCTGASVVTSYVANAIQGVQYNRPVYRPVYSVVALILSALFVNCNYAPFIFSLDPLSTNETAFGQTFFDLYNGYFPERVQSYTIGEQEFVRKVQEIVPDNEVILNLPADGSTYAYSVDGLNVYYRGVGGAGETQDSELIRKQLDQIADDDQVQLAVSKTGASYVMLLDRSDFSEEKQDDGTTRLVSHNFECNEDDWRGLLNINDGTPGFDLVLSEGNCRLYQIVQQ